MAVGYIDLPKKRRIIPFCAILTDVLGFSFTLFSTYLKSRKLLWIAVWCGVSETPKIRIALAFLSDLYFCRGRYLIPLSFWGIWACGFGNRIRKGTDHWTDARLLYEFLYESVPLMIRYDKFQCKPSSPKLFTTT